MSFSGLAVQRARCLALLIARGADGATTDELSDPAVGGHEGPRRVRELRKAGQPVQRARLANGWWRYWLGGPALARQLDLTWEEPD
jgi:hypothetical protein